MLSIVIESLTKTILLLWCIALKSFALWDEEERKQVITVVLSVILSFGVDLDIFATANIPFKIPVLGPLLTGLLFARGAGVINDILDIIYYSKVYRKDNLEKQQ